MKSRKCVPVRVANLVAQSGADQYTDWIDTLSYDGVIVHVHLTAAGGGITLFGQGSPLGAPTSAAVDGGNINDYASTVITSGALAATTRFTWMVTPFGSLPRKFRGRIAFGGAAVTGTIDFELVKTSGLA